MRLFKAFRGLHGQFNEQLKQGGFTGLVGTFRAGSDRFPGSFSLEISAKHAGIRFNVVKMHFENRDAAKEWILKNQLGRRNLPSYVRAQLALRLKPIIAEKAKEKQSEGGGAVRQKSDKAVIDTKKELATIAGVSHDTIHKVEVVEKHGTPEIKAKARSGENPQTDHRALRETWKHVPHDF